MSETSNAPFVAVIGAGPAGLMAAGVLSHNGVCVEVLDAVPLAGRKSLLAGVGGVNITHSEPLDTLLGRYRTWREALAPLIGRFSSDALRAWTHRPGIDTFAGSLSRVFPTEMKTAPLLCTWLHCLRESGVQLYMRYRWVGWVEPLDHAQMLRFETVDVEQLVQADAAILAVGGGSQPRLGSDGVWVPLLEARGVQVQPLQPANCGFDAGWSAYSQERFVGQSMKSVTIDLRSVKDGTLQSRQGEFAVTQTDVEGGFVYVLSAPIRDALAAEGSATIWFDLVPDWSMQRVTDELMRPRGARPTLSHLQSKLNTTGVKLGLLRECLSKGVFVDLAQLAKAIKTPLLRLTCTRPIEEAISTAGGVAFEALDVKLMIEHPPSMFYAGEMLDWEVPTGGCLLMVYFASGAVAGQGAFDYLARMVH